MLTTFLRRSGLMADDDRPIATPLTGGVSSDIWRIDFRAGPICVKRALLKLRVDADWYAPIERNAFEVAWIETANSVQPGIAPKILAHDPVQGLFAMAFLDPSNHPTWKDCLRAGDADAASAKSVGASLRRIHDATRGSPEIAHKFKTDETFWAIRLEPYLIAAGRAHPDIAPQLESLAQSTADTKEALVHGDVSPKNILVSDTGPIFIDAECAWYGDPAFDLAFCLNHLLLKCLWTPAAQAGYLNCFDAMCDGYAPDTATEARTATLLPALFLARVDGKSPVEYITTDAARDQVRRAAIPLIRNPERELGAIRDAWKKELA